MPSRRGHRRARLRLVRDPRASGGVSKTLDANRIAAATPFEPLRSQPIPSRIAPRVRRVGEVRLPIAGPYRPRARLYRYPDGRLLWLVRLWEYDRAVRHLVSTAVLREFARLNRLPRLRAEIDDLVDRSAGRGGP